MYSIPYCFAGQQVNSGYRADVSSGRSFVIRQIGKMV